MERLTKQMGDKYFYKSMPYKDNFYISQVVTKLGKLEDIEQELGITLEVLFKALKDGIMINSNGILRNLNGIELSYNGYFECWFFEYGMGTANVKLKDYGKTWWLEKSKEELENAKD
jgi:hypothetical protein